jgi:hypothetical protein
MWEVIMKGPFDTNFNEYMIGKQGSTNWSLDGGEWSPSNTWYKKDFRDSSSTILFLLKKKKPHPENE